MVFFLFPSFAAVEPLDRALVENQPANGDKALAAVPVLPSVPPGRWALGDSTVPEKVALAGSVERAFSCSVSKTAEVNQARG